MSRSNAVTEVITLSSDEEYIEPCSKRVKKPKVNYTSALSATNSMKKGVNGRNCSSKISESSCFHKTLLKTKSNTELPSRATTSNGTVSVLQSLNAVAGEHDSGSQQHSLKQKCEDILMECEPPRKKSLVVNKKESPKNSKVVFDEFLNFAKLEMAVPADEETQIINKLQSSFAAADPQYIDSSEFCSLVGSVTKKITEDKQNIFVYILDLNRELKLRKKRKSEAIGVPHAQSSVAVGYFTAEPGPSKVKPETMAGSSSAMPKSVDDSRDINNPVKAKYIKKLEKLLKKIHKKIEKLSNRELSLDDLETDDSYYIREDLLKKRFVKVYNLICKETQCSSKAERHIYKKFHYAGTKYTELNKRVEDMVNKERLFPDFPYIYNMVKSFSEESNMKMLPTQIENLAKDVFSDVGKELKHRRQLDDFDIMESYLLKSNVVSDPAEKDVDLGKCLEQSMKDGNAKMQQVIDEYVQKQCALQEHPVEVPDDVASSSPSSDDDDDDEEEEEEEFNPEKVEVFSDSSETKHPEHLSDVEEEESIAVKDSEVNHNNTEEHN